LPYQDIGLVPLAVFHEGADGGELGLGRVVPAGRAEDDVFELGTSRNLEAKGLS
jgi:hypothetical protein